MRGSAAVLLCASLLVVAAGPPAGADGTAAPSPAVRPTVPASPSAGSTGSTASPAGGTAAPAGPLAALVPGAAALPAPREVFPGLPTTAPAPTTAGLERVIGPLLRRAGLGGSVSAEVVDLASGASLFSESPSRMLVPASTAKLLTGAAALSLLGPGTRLATTVVDGTTKDEVVLVGGGDVLLSAGAGNPGQVVGHAGLADLADATAAALAGQGRRSVVVRLDDSLFRPPAVDPAWASDVAAGFVAPVMALEVNGGTADPKAPLPAGLPLPRDADPAGSAARTFSRLLAARGVRVTGRVERVQAPRGTPALARVESAPVGDLVEHALSESDNTVAEALARLVGARSGRPATFADSAVAVLDRLDLLGVPTSGARLAGGSGLGTGNAGSARMLTAVLALAASDGHPELRPVLSGLPVAGASGTLAERFVSKRARAGLGRVRAKTGTLTGVSSLAGTVVTAEGRQLGFVVLADRVGATLDARKALDDVAAALAGCGCR